ncbi:YndJ family protein [Streptomyces sp. ODS05-4]|uniref:YndJ family protein n=1 Tax=Streptomyces sp. ODS05-4 TaxID=2944939 RepID=UPI00210E3048|nr:YndJ family protein [Streptomyces sp. ODS05-4]
MWPLVNLIVALGMLVVVPLGLGLLDEAEFRTARRLWPCFAAPGAVCLWLPRSALATTLAALYAVGAALLVGHAAARLRRSGRAALAPAGVAALTALVSPAVAASALVAERAGHPLFGFSPEILALTVPHFHFAGFAAALVAGLVYRTADRPAARFAAYSVPSGTLLVLAGYFTDDWAELLGALVLTAGMTAVAALTWRDVRVTGRDRVTRALLAVAAVVLPVTMALALSWALGQATGLPHPSLAWMAATHGLGNAVGFALCSLLAWRRLHAPARARTGPAPLPVRPETTRSAMTLRTTR